MSKKAAKAEIKYYQKLQGKNHRIRHREVQGSSEKQVGEEHANCIDVKEELFAGIAA